MCATVFVRSFFFCYWLYFALNGKILFFFFILSQTQQHSTHSRDIKTLTSCRINFLLREHRQRGIHHIHHKTIVDPERHLLMTARQTLDTIEYFISPNLSRFLAILVEMDSGDMAEQPIWASNVDRWPLTSQILHHGSIQLELLIKSVPRPLTRPPESLRYLKLET